MSVPVPPERGTPVLGLLLSAEVALDVVLQVLGRELGAPRRVSPEVPFDDAGYYEGEMGRGIRRVFAALAGTRDPGDLVGLKEAANGLEARWAGPSGRRVNLDPGLLNLDQVVLATGKPAGHRVYLARGIYAEVEYRFQDGTFLPLPWTYPDYRRPDAVAFFNRVRSDHRERRRALRKETG